MYLMWVHSLASSGERIGLWLEDFDADAHGGRGQASLTHDKARARHFRSSTDAFAFWRQVSRRQPVRHDGKPNRPLTAYSIELLPETEDPTF